MSAIARYFIHEGYRVAGYDRTATPLTRNLEAEGAAVHYDDDPELIPPYMRSAEDTMVVLTPAIPADHKEWAWLRERDFSINKRSEVLGYLSSDKLGMAVAGTHGKTTTSTLAAWLNYAAAGEGSAFLGGISQKRTVVFVGFEYHATSATQHQIRLEVSRYASQEGAALACCGVV